MAVVALKPKVANQLGFNFPLSNNPSPAAQMGRKLECREGQDVRERSFSHGRTCDMARLVLQHAFERVSGMSSWLVVHGCICSTTLRRWYRGYHGFKPELTNKLALSCQFTITCGANGHAVKDRTSENSPFRTGDPVTRCKYIYVHLDHINAFMGNRSNTAYVYPTCL